MTWSGYSEQGQGSQERGPSTFAVDVPRTQQGAAATGAGGVDARGGVRFVGNGTSSVGRIAEAGTRAPQAASVKDGTFDLLMQLGQVTLAPRIAAMKKEAEVAGAVQHASGVALEEIINEQPWYANVFGTAPAVEGARAYGARAATARFVQTNLENMETLAQQPPEALVGQLTEQMKQHLTGDPATDAVIQQELIGQLPTLIKTHTKAHVAYMQKKADEATYSAMVADAEKFGAIMNSELSGDADKAQALASLADTFVLPEGRNPASHWKNLTNVMIDQATKGNSHFLAAATQAGMLETLPPDYRDVVKAGIGKAAPGIFSKLLAQDLDLLTATVALSTNPPDTPEEIQAEWERINSVAALRTGIPQDLAKLNGVNTLTSAIGLDMRRDEAERQRAETAVQTSMRKQLEQVQKDQDENRMKLTFSAALDGLIQDPAANVFIQGKGAAKALGLTEEQAGEVWRARLNATDAAGVGRLLSRSPRETHPVIKERLGTWYSAALRPQDKEAWQGAWTQLVTMAQQVPDEATLATHLGEEEAQTVKFVQELIASNVDFQTAITIGVKEAPARRAAAKWRSQADDKKQEAARELVSDYVQNSIGKTDSFRTWRSLTGGRKPDPYQVEMLSGILANADSGMLSTPKAGLQVAMNRLTSGGQLTVAGGGFTMNFDAADALALPLHAAIGLPAAGMEDSVHEALFIRAEEELRKVGYGMTRSTTEHIGDVVRNLMSPVQGTALSRMIPKDTGFEATGYTVARLPRDRNSRTVTYAVTYEQDGVPKQVHVTSDMVLATYNGIVGAARKGPKPAEVGTDSLMFPSGLIE